MTPRSTSILLSQHTPVPAKLVKKIQEGLFIEMAELLLETLSSPEYAAVDEPTSQKQKPREVTNIVDWVQMFWYLHGYCFPKRTKQNP